MTHSVFSRNKIFVWRCSDVCRKAFNSRTIVRVPILEDGRVLYFFVSYVDLMTKSFVARFVSEFHICITFITLLDKFF